MDHLSDADFTQRACDIFINGQLDTPPQALVNAPPMGWEYLWRDVLDEAFNRFGESVAREFVEHVKASCAESWRSRPRVTPALAADEAAAFLRRGQVDGQFFLIRYSKRERLADLVSHGRLRIYPATRYDDPSLNPAIRDKELELAIQPHGLTAEVFDKTGRSKGTMAVIGNLLTSVSPTNFYVHCMSGFLSPDLFPDFDADACLVIRQPHVYAKRVLDGLNERLPYPAWAGSIEAVKYVDPLNTACRQFNVQVAKHFRFAYQQEWRITWWPAQYARDLPHLDLELGNMDDCCTLLCL